MNWWHISIDFNLKTFESYVHVRLGYKSFPFYSDKIVRYFGERRHFSLTFYIIMYIDLFVFNYKLKESQIRQDQWRRVYNLNTKLIQCFTDELWTTLIHPLFFEFEWVIFCIILWYQLWPMCCKINFIARLWHRFL